ncbi:MAG: FAD/NAD(P)-binding oxidoreductase [Gammaproteobacteria bacterium]|jgi:sulfide:quinone oxidoreductase
MARVVVVGAGLGGLPAAYDIKEALGKSHEVTVINPVEEFQFIPSNPWVLVGWRERDAVTVPLRKPLEKKGIEFIAHGAKEIRPSENVVVLDNSEKIAYDYLVITTGPTLDYDAIPGLGPINGHTQSVCTLDHAMRGHAAYEEFLGDPGPIVVGAVQGASCFGPAYETAMILDTDLRKRKLRHKVPMTFVTSEPYIGHLGLGGVGDSKGMLESALRDRHINFITNAKVDDIGATEMKVTEHDADGKPIREHTLPFSFSMLLPAFKGVDAVAAATEICNPKGFVVIDDYQRNPNYHNIFAAGVCVAIAPPVPTPVPTGVPKTGYMIESMVTAIVENIKADLEGRQPEATATWNAICLADMGDSGMAFVALPQIPPRNVTWAKEGKWVHLAKVGFEKYFLRKMKSGSTEPFYEKYILKALGIMRLGER